MCGKLGPIISLPVNRAFYKGDIACSQRIAFLYFSRSKIPHQYHWGACGSAGVYGIVFGGASYLLPM